MIKSWGQFLALIAKWADIWLRGREQQGRQERDDKVADDPGSAFDSHFGGVSRGDNAPTPNKSDAPDDSSPK